MPLKIHNAVLPPLQTKRRTAVENKPVVPTQRTTTTTTIATAVPVSRLNLANINANNHHRRVNTCNNDWWTKVEGRSTIDTAWPRTATVLMIWILFSTRPLQKQLPIKIKWHPHPNHFKPPHPPSYPPSRRKKKNSPNTKKKTEKNQMKRTMSWNKDQKKWTPITMTNRHRRFHQRPMLPLLIQPHAIPLPPKPLGRLLRRRRRKRRKRRKRKRL